MPAWLAPDLATTYFGGKRELSARLAGSGRSNHVIWRPALTPHELKAALTPQADVAGGPPAR